MMRNLLSGVRIVDLSRALAGPYGSMLLGDMGAEVIKVEEKGGDPTRGTMPRLEAGDGSYFISVNRSKKSVVLDLTSGEGKAVFHDLVRIADVVYDNYRPKALRKLGCDYESVRKINPQIISCSISGYGQTGEWQDRPAYDLIVQALAGTMSLNGEPGRPPARLGIPMGDLAGGMFAAMAIGGALYQRSVTGMGTAIDVSLLDCQVSLLTYLAQSYLLNGEVPGPQGSGHTLMPVYGAFETADGYLVVATPAGPFWPKLCRAVGLGELAEDPRYVGRRAQSERWHEIRALFQERFLGKTTEEWVGILADEDVPAAPINRLDKALAHSQVAHRKMVVDVEYPPVGRPIQMVGNPVKVAGVDDARFSPPPSLGEQTEEVLGDLLGYPAGEIARLREAGAIA